MFFVESRCDKMLRLRDITMLLVLNRRYEMILEANNALWLENEYDQNETIEMDE